MLGVVVVAAAAAAAIHTDTFVCVSLQLTPQASSPAVSHQENGKGKSLQVLYLDLDYPRRNAPRREVLKRKKQPMPIGTPATNHLKKRSVRILPQQGRA